MRKILGAATLVALALCPPAHATVVGWGPNHRGELGAGYKSPPQAPVSDRELPPVIQAVATYHTSYALLANGTVLAWGGNTWGQLGDGNHRESGLTVQVRGLSGVTQIAAGGAHAMALLSNGTVETWGSDMFGTLGNGTTGAGREKGGSDVPIPVRGLRGVVAIAAGGADNYALLSNGTLMAWGENKSGQLGDGTTTEKTAPTPVRGVSSVRAVAAGGIATLGGHTLALLDNGTVLAWGANGSGQLGNGANVSTTAPVQVQDLAGVSAISASVSHSLALLSNGSVWSWGSNLHGELGVQASELCGPSPCSRIPVRVMGGASAISAGFGFSEAISAGHVFSWGWNEHYQLGSGADTDLSRPEMIPGLSEVNTISAGEYHSLAMTSGPGPAPLLQAIPGRGSLALQWLACAGAGPAMVSYRRAVRPQLKWSKAIKLPASALGYTFSGLAAEPYEVLLRRVGEGIVTMAATPLP